MTGQLCTVLAGCLLAMIFGTSSARAASGRIVFSGSIVTPTCAVADVSAESTRSISTRPGSTSREFVCGNSGSPAGSGGSYSVTVTTLGGATKSDRLLAYFTGYVTVAGAGTPSAKLVTQTFD